MNDLFTDDQISWLQFGLNFLLTDNKELTEKDKDAIEDTLVQLDENI